MSVNRTNDSDKGSHTTRELFRASASRTILSILRRKGRCTADDVRHAISIPDGVNPSILGPVFSSLSRDKLIVVDDITTTRRAVAHGRLCRVWKLAPHDGETGK